MTYITTIQDTLVKLTFTSHVKELTSVSRLPKQWQPIYAWQQLLIELNCKQLQLFKESQNISTHITFSYTIINIRSIPPKVSIRTKSTFIIFHLSAKNNTQYDQCLTREPMVTLEQYAFLFFVTFLLVSHCDSSLTE